MQISAVVITKNEEKNLTKCLQSIKWCNEIVVVDDFSIDNTISIAKKFGAKVYKRNLNNDFATQRNFGLSKTKCAWVFFIDADEVVSPALKNEILAAVKDKTFEAYYLIRRNYLLEKELRHGEFSNYGWFGNAKLLRLGKRNSGKWKRAVHEFWEVKGSVGLLQNSLMHFSHTDLQGFISNINFFSNLHATALKKDGKKASVLKIIVWPVGKFIYNYLFRLGFMDGVEGFIVAILMSLHSFLAWSKLWLA